MDLSVYHSLNDFAYRHAAVGDAARFFANTAIVIVVVALALVCLLPGRWARPADRRAIAAAAASAGLALVLAVIIGHIWDRARPFLHHAHHLLIAHGADASFPSDHVAALSAITAALLLRRRRIGWAVLAVTVLVAVARVMVGVHYPTDVLGGAAVGVLAALALTIPVARSALDRLADGVGGAYDRVTARALAGGAASKP